MKQLLGRYVLSMAVMAMWASALLAQSADNQLTPQESTAGVELLFDGKSTTGWKLGNGKDLPAENVQDGAINPHKAGAGWVYFDKKFGDFAFSCDFKVSEGCNSGIFLLVGDPKDEVYTGLEMQVLDSAAKGTPGKHDSGAIYDIMPPKVNAMQPAGQWNHVEISCQDGRINIIMNRQHIIQMNLNQWMEPGKNPDGTTHKFKKLALKDLVRPGYIGFQDHGQPVWFKNIKIRNLPKLAGADTGKSDDAPKKDVPPPAVKQGKVPNRLPTDTQQKDRKRVLLLTESKGFVHSVVRRPKDGGLCMVEEVFQDLAKKHGFDVVCSQDSRKDITAENLKNFDAVWFYTTGTLPLSETQKADLINFVRKGGGFGGCHSATDTFYDWPEYGQLVGAYFDGHPWHQKVTVLVEDTNHPATRHLGKSFVITDEIYQFKSPYSRDKLKVLMKLDMSDLKNKGKRKDLDNALAWTSEFGKGRVFYTALGHREDVWQDPRFQQHIIGGLMYLFGTDAKTLPGAEAPPVKIDGGSR